MFTDKLKTFLTRYPQNPKICFHKQNYVIITLAARALARSLARRFREMELLYLISRDAMSWQGHSQLKGFQHTVRGKGVRGAGRPCVMFLVLLLLHAQCTTRACRRKPPLKKTDPSSVGRSVSTYKDKSGACHHKQRLLH